MGEEDMKNNKKLRKERYVSEDTKEVTRLLLITLGVVVVALGLYFLTTKVVNKNEEKGTETSFDYSVATVGTMFNRPYDEYYVFLFDSTKDNASQYRSLISSYEAKDESIKIYTVDLSMNKDGNYLSDESNNNPTSPSEVKIKESALVLIKDGKVSKYYESIEDYEKVLK